MRPFKIAHFLLTGALILGGCAGTQGSQTPMQSSPTPVAATLTPSTPAPDGRAHLTLITCAGSVVDGAYDHRLVVYATRSETK